MPDKNKTTQQRQAGCLLSIVLFVTGLIFAVFWGGIVMGEGPPGVYVDRSRAYLFGLLTILCWGVGIAVVVRAFSRK